MGQILSQSEVESILSGLDLATNPIVSNVETAGAQEMVPTAIYDFEHPEPLRRSQLDTLRLASASASQSLQASLSRTLRSSFLVNFLGVEQSTYHDYLATAEIPSCIAVLESNDSPNAWLLDISRHLVFTFVDCMLGGRPGDTSLLATPNRPNTEVETRLIERTLQAILPDLAGSFTRQTSLRMTRLISDSSIMYESTSNEAVALVTFEVVCGAKQGLMQLCIPWKQVAKSPNCAQYTNAHIQNVMSSVATKIPVVATAQIGRISLSARELANLNPGDVLLTDVSPADEITLKIDGSTIFRGNPGQSQNHKVIRLTVPMSPAATDEK